MATSSNNNNAPNKLSQQQHGVLTVTAEDDEISSTAMPEKTDMVKVNFLMSRPLLLLDMLPKDKRQEMAAHVGRRNASSSNRPRTR